MKSWNYLYEVPDEKKVRMLIHTDCKNEADDQFAVAHHLMTPKFLVKGIIGAHFNSNPRDYGDGHTAKASMEEIDKVLKLMDLDGICPVKKGAERPMQDEITPIPSEGAQLIIDEAMKDDPHPLYIACQGSITDLASAILMKPEICSRMTVIWIGGGIYPEGGPEFNQDQDVAAANVVMKSTMPLWQVPKNVYKQMSVSLAELQANVEPCGEIGHYLFAQMAEFNRQCAHHPDWPHGEIWGIGDNPTISVLMMEQERTDVYDVLPAPEIDYTSHCYIHTGKNRAIRVYKDVDARLTIADLFAKLKINYG
jgi:inosine-uridine nucleoside N-ribohydrolase